MAHNPGDLPAKQPSADDPDAPFGRWADGTPVTKEENDELLAQASGAPPTPGSGVDTGIHGESPLDRYAQDFIPKQIAAGAPGASLDVGNSEAERGRLQGLLEQLQQQAATGGGEWEATLADATARAQATASALGQAQANTGGSYASSLRNIGNAESAAAQRAVGQGNILRAQAKQGAEGQLEDLLAAQGGQDVDQARLSAAALQQRREANAELVAQARARAEGIAGAAGQAAMSDGGSVPGKPQVFGDDSRNDTVPAMLSPGEIVVPRSKAGDPEAAADFARAVAARKGAQGLAEGTPNYGLDDLPGPTTEEGAEIGLMPHVGIADYYRRLGGPQEASIENGGLLDFGNFNTTRQATLGLAGLLEGSRPTVTGQQLTNAADDTVSGAMAQTQQTSNAANVLSSAVAAQQGAGGEAAATRGNEQARTQQLLQKTLSRQRGQDLGMALAAQQAGWRNTALNAGLLSQAQQAIVNAVSGGAQAIGALSHAGKGESDEEPFNLDYDPDAGSGDEALYNPGSESGDYPESDDESQYAAHGGVIQEPDERERAHRFLKKLARAA